MSRLALVKLVRSNPEVGNNRLPGSRIPEEMLKCTHRPAGADFYCWRFKIWYSTLDCAFRTKHQTYDGCADCSQGIFNLKARARVLQIERYLGDSKP